MAENKCKQNSTQKVVDRLNLESNGSLEEDKSEEAVLLSPKDRIRRQKIFESCFGWKSPDKIKSSSNNSPLDMFSTYHQSALAGFSSEDAFETLEYEGLANRESSFSFPQRPIEQEVLKQEEVEIEQRANRKRKETLSSQNDKFAYQGDLNDHISVKEIPFYQRVNVGKESAAGVSSDICVWLVFVLFLFLILALVFLAFEIMINVEVSIFHAQKLNCTLK